MKAALKESAVMSALTVVLFVFADAGWWSFLVVPYGFWEFNRGYTFWRNTNNGSERGN